MLASQPAIAEDQLPPEGKPLPKKYLLKPITLENYDPTLLNRRLMEVESSDWEAPNPRKTKAYRKHVHRSHVRNMTSEGRQRYLKHIRDHRRINRTRRANNKPPLKINAFDFASVRKPVPIEKSQQAPASQTESTGKNSPQQASPLTTPSGMSQYEYQLLQYRADLMAWWTGLTDGQKAVQQSSFNERLMEVDARIEAERKKQHTSSGKETSQ